MNNYDYDAMKDAIKESIHKTFGGFRYHNITKDDMKNGDGLRVVLWVSGCTHHCKGCHNPVTWDPEDGLIFDDNAKQELFNELDKDYISGITFSGGDPLASYNAPYIRNLITEIRDKYPNKTIWVYTGFTIEEILDKMPVNFNLVPSIFV